MSNETKRDVFENALDELLLSKDDGALDAELRCRYDAALPDDLPVIPKAVGEILQSAYGQNNLYGVLDTARNGYKVSEPLVWIIVNQNTFARAWVLGVWRVEETGEIVKLEADK